MSTETLSDKIVEANKLANVSKNLRDAKFEMLTSTASKDFLVLKYL